MFERAALAVLKNQALESPFLHSQARSEPRLYCKDQNGHASGYTIYYYGARGERLGVFNFTVGYYGTGTVSYTYNSTNTLASKTDNKGQKFTYAYDTYNRLTTISVNGTLLRTFIYDTNTLDNTGFSQNTAGRLAAVQNAQVSSGFQLVEMYSYVGAGTAGAGLPSKKRLQVSHAISGPNGIATQTLDLDAAYTYNNEGAVPSTTYPSIYPNGVNGSPVAGPVNTYTSFDGMNRPIALNTTTVNGVSYGPSNELLAVTYNSIAETRTYNTLLQLTAVTATLGVNYVNMQYNYPAPGSNNGKACLATDLVTGEQIAYGYDSLNRWLRRMPTRSRARRARIVVPLQAHRPGAKHILLTGMETCRIRPGRAVRHRWRSVTMAPIIRLGSRARNTTLTEI